MPTIIERQQHHSALLYWETEPKAGRQGKCFELDGQ